MRVPDREKTAKLVQPVRLVPGEPLAEVGGVNVHAKVAFDGRHRPRLERLCRYLARPPLAQERLSLHSDGRVRLTFKAPWMDGTHAVLLGGAERGMVAVVLVAVIISGVKVRHEALFECRAFCGRCVGVTSQVVFRTLEQEHVFFVGVGAPDSREARCCAECELVAGCRADTIDPDGGDPWAGLAAEERARLETDAFLRAHADVAVKVRWTPRVVLAAALILAALAALGWLVATSLDVGFAACGLVLGLAPVALLVHREAARRAIERDVAREIAPRLARLLERTGGRLSALAPRARRLRLNDLARLLDSPVLARAFAPAGPLSLIEPTIRRAPPTGAQLPRAQLHLVFG